MRKQNKNEICKKLKTWPVVTLNEIAEKITKGTTPTSYGFRYQSNGIKFLRVENIGEEGKLTYEDVKYIDEKTHAVLSRSQLKEGDILISIAGAIGRSAIVDRKDLPANINQAISIVRLKDDRVNHHFVCYAVASSAVQGHLTYIQAGLAQPNLNLKQVGEIKIPLPPLEEQKKIVHVLVIWDNAIKKTEKLIFKRKLFKQALMQQLLTGKLRFKEFSKKAVHKAELGEFLIPTPRPIPRPSSLYTALGIRSHGKGTFLKIVENPETVMMDTLYEVKENDLIVNITFAWEGAIAIVKISDEGALVSHRFPTYTFNREIAIPEYFRHVIQTKRLVHELGLVSPGGAGRNRVMSKTDFLNIVISIPSVDEQKKIAAVLNGVDKEIELLEKKLKCLKTQKKGLMQKLLTGQIRVKM